MDSPDMTPYKSFRCGRGQGHVTLVNFWALIANSSKTAKGTNFKFDRHVPGTVATWPLRKVSETLAWPGSRDRDNSRPTVQTHSLQQWDRYRVAQNVFLFGYKSHSIKGWENLGLLVVKLLTLWVKGQRFDAAANKMVLLFTGLGTWEVERL